MSSSQGFSRGRRGLGGRGSGSSRGRGMRGRGRGRGRGRMDRKEWIPVTKLGKLVKAGKITTLNEIFLYSIPIKEYQIIDKILGPDILKRNLLGIAPVQKQTTAGQRTRFKAVTIVGDESYIVGIGIKCAKEASSAIKGSLNIAKLSLVPVRKGYWGSKYGEPHTVPSKTTGKCGSVRIRLIPAPRGTGIVAAKISKSVLQLAGFEDVYTSSTGKTRTMANFAKATFIACAKTYGYLTPDLWTDYSDPLDTSPLFKFSSEFNDDNKGNNDKNKISVGNNRETNNKKGFNRNRDSFREKNESKNE